MKKKTGSAVEWDDLEVVFKDEEGRIISGNIEIVLPDTDCDGGFIDDEDLQS